MKITKNQLREVIKEEIKQILEGRNYKSEYENYQSNPEQKKRRAERNSARRKMERLGNVKKGDNKDVHHRNGNTSDNSSSNLVVMDKSKNRSIK